MRYDFDSDFMHRFEPVTLRRALPMAHFIITVSLRLSIVKLLSFLFQNYRKQNEIVKHENHHRATKLDLF